METDKPIATKPEPVAESAATCAPWAPAPRDVETLKAVQRSLVFPHFTADDIFALGSALRARLLPNPIPVAIAILGPSHRSHPRTLFWTITRAGTINDSDMWVQRKAATVLRFGVPTWQLGVAYSGDAGAWQKKFGLSEEEASRMTVSGGGVPVFVEGVDTIVAVVVVSGLKQDDDHAVIVETMQKYLEGLKK